MHPSSIVNEMNASEHNLNGNIPFDWVYLYEHVNKHIGLNKTAQ